MKSFEQKPFLNFSELRIEALGQILGKLKELLLKDELINTLNSDGVSKEFINLRIQEIIENFLNNDRELLLGKTMKKYSKLKENCQTRIKELTEEAMKERIKNKELEEAYLIDEKKIQILEKKLSEFQATQEKNVALEKGYSKLQRKLDDVANEKEAIEKKYKIFALELEKSFIEEKEQKTEENDKYKSKLKYYKSTIEQLVQRLDEYEGKSREVEEKMRELYKDNVQLKEEIKCLASENNSNKAKAKIYKNLNNKIKIQFITKVKEICSEMKRDQKLLGRWIKDYFSSIMAYFNESAKELNKRIQLYRMKYQGVKETLEGKIQRLQSNLSAIMGKFENVKGSFNIEYEDKIREIQRFQESLINTEKINQNLRAENESFKRIVEEKEREIERFCYEKQKLMEEIMADDVKYKKLAVGYEEEMGRNRALMKEIGSLNEMLLKKNYNEGMKAELLKKIQKITKKW